MFGGYCIFFKKHFNLTCRFMWNEIYFRSFFTVRSHVCTPVHEPFSIRFSFWIDYFYEFQTYRQILRVQGGRVSTTTLRGPDYHILQFKMGNWHDFSPPKYKYIRGGVNFFWNLYLKLECNYNENHLLRNDRYGRVPTHVSKKCKPIKVSC